VTDVPTASASSQSHNLSALDSEIAKLKERITELETRWKITVALAAIFSIGGGWIGTQLLHFVSESKTLADTVDAKKAEALNAIQSAKSDAIESERQSLKGIAEHLLRTSLGSLRDKAPHDVSLETGPVECPAGTFVSSIGPVTRVGGDYGGDAVRHINFYCSPVVNPEK
jgi:hypothetical protein